MREPIEAEWRPLPPRPGWRDVWYASRWLLPIGGLYCLLCLLAIIWGVVVGW